MRNHIYRHRVWVNAADARVRGISDNDTVMVFNDRGRVILKAYVTQRMMPGTVLIHGGAGVFLNDDGVDIGAAASTLLGGDTKAAPPAQATNRSRYESRGNHTMTQYGFFIDTSRCTGCQACGIACKEWHDIPPDG